MEETIRSVLWCAAACISILLAAQVLRVSGALSFLPEEHVGEVVTVLGNAVSQTGWSDELVAVFAEQTQDDNCKITD